jgi:hypothetical protein
MVTQVWLKMKRWQMCCDDCDMALALLVHDVGRNTANNQQAELDQQLAAKLLLRRASAHKELGNIKEARVVGTVVADVYQEICQPGSCVHSHNHFHLARTNTTAHTTHIPTYHICMHTGWPHHLAY